MENKTYELTMLYDFFGELLTDTQREYFEYYYSDDLSLGEISEITGVSRQGVRGVLKRAEDLLRQYEARTGVVERFRRVASSVDDLRAKVSELIELTDGRAGELAREIYVSLGDLKG